MSVLHSGLRIGPDVEFSENKAAFSYFPPLHVETAFPNIQSRSATVYHHPFNNVDIGFDFFTQPPLITLTIINHPGGVIKIAGELLSGEVGFFGVRDVEVIAESNPGYRFVSWMSTFGSFTDSSSPNTIFTTADQNTVLSANFEEFEETGSTFLDIFPDQNLAQIVAGQFGRNVTDEVSIPELNQLQGSINAENRNISHLEGVQHLTSLATLLLSHNQIANIEPLRQLTNLT